VEEPVIVLDIKDIRKIRASEGFIYISLSMIYLAIYQGWQRAEPVLAREMARRHLVTYISYF